VTWRLVRVLVVVMGVDMRSHVWILFCMFSLLFFLELNSFIIRFYTSGIWIQMPCLRPAILEGLSFDLYLGKWISVWFLGFFEEAQHQIEVIEVFDMRYPMGQLTIAYYYFQHSSLKFLTLPLIFGSMKPTSILSNQMWGDSNINQFNRLKIWNSRMTA